MTIADALREASQSLSDGGVAAPRLTSEVLLSHVLGKGREYLFAHSADTLSESDLGRYRAFVAERLEGRPTQYITGRQEFYGREFMVTPDVLIPRPETEHVVEVALEVAPHARSIVDVGCGSGAIAATLSLELRRPALGTDVSVPALAVARENARRLGADVRLAGCDLLSALAPKSADLIVSNPPYVPLEDEPGLQREVRDYEPRVALFGGATGLDVYRRIIADAPRVLRPRGWLIMELGFKTSRPVRRMLDARWEPVRLIPDLAGIERVLAAKLRE